MTCGGLFAPERTLFLTKLPRKAINATENKPGEENNLKCQAVVALQVVIKDRSQITNYIRKGRWDKA